MVSAYRYVNLFISKSSNKHPLSFPNTPYVYQNGNLKNLRLRTVPHHISSLHFMRLSQTASRPSAFRTSTTMTIMLVLLLLHISYAACFTFFDEHNRPGSYHTTSTEPETWLTTHTVDWLSQLPDTTPLHRISIPGTHDTAAIFGGGLCETQSWSILEQLEAGIRYFDIRNRRAGHVFALHHGICFQKIFFGGVLEQIDAFLEEHPGEVVVMRVKEEHEPKEGSDSFQKIWDGYMKQYSHLFVPSMTRLPTLGEVRGRVLVLRNAEFVGYGIEYAGGLTEIQDYYKVFLVLSDHLFGDDTASLGQKKRFLREFLTKATNGKKLVLNHWSCTQGLLPITCARATNQDGYQAIGPYKKRKTTGIVIMDFPGERLIYRIIKTNFESERKCGESVWRAQSDKTFSEFRIPASRVGTIRTVRKGSYHRFVFPKCHRANWSDLRFSCEEDGWKFYGDLDADGVCFSYNTQGRYLTVGHR